MNLTEILIELERLSLKINPNPKPFSVKLRPINPIINIGTPTGVEVDINDVDIDPNTGTWMYKGRHVLLFIPDHSFNFDSVMAGEKEGNKFHLTDCNTITNMKKRKRFTRYRVTQSTEGIFEIFGSHKNNKGRIKLHVCKTCLVKLNYKKYNNAAKIKKDEIYTNFNLVEFFEQLQSTFATEPPDVGQGQGGYPDNWSEISKKYREYKNWVCEQCNVDLSRYHSLLDVHHIDGVKQHNNHSNLKALCKECHSKQPSHGHYRISNYDIELLHTIRQEQGLI